MSHLLDGKKLAVIGDPIEHSLSPIIQQAMLDELGISCTYERILVQAGSVAAWLPSAPELNLAGFNATMPHKTDLVPLMDTLSDDARMYRSVNTVVIREGRFHGHNTDGEGFLRALHDAGMEHRNRRVVVYGAGGAARSVVLKLTAAGAENVTVCCRTPKKAEELAARSPRTGEPDPLDRPQPARTGSGLLQLGRLHPDRHPRTGPAQSPRPGDPAPSPSRWRCTPGTGQTPLPPWRAGCCWCRRLHPW